MWSRLRGRPSQRTLAGFSPGRCPRRRLRRRIDMWRVLRIRIYVICFDQPDVLLRWWVAAVIPLSGLSRCVVMHRCRRRTFHGLQAGCAMQRESQWLLRRSRPSLGLLGTVQHRCLRILRRARLGVLKQENVLERIITTVIITWGGKKCNMRSFRPNSLYKNM